MNNAKWVKGIVVLCLVAGGMLPLPGSMGILSAAAADAKAVGLKVEKLAQAERAAENEKKITELEEQKVELQAQVEELKKEIQRFRQRTGDEVDVVMRASTNLLAAVEIEEIEFRQASIEDVVKFFNNCLAGSGFKSTPDYLDRQVRARRTRIETLNGEIAGIRARAAELAANKDEPRRPDAKKIVVEGLDAPGTEAVPVISFSARYISLKEALQIVAQIVDLKAETREGVIALRPWRKGERPAPALLPETVPGLDPFVTPKTPAP